MQRIAVEEFQPVVGDIFACWGTDLISRGVSLETSLLSWATGPGGLRWSPSHVALASSVKTPTGDLLSGLNWVESTTLCGRECLAAGEMVSGVQVHSIPDRAGDYLNGGGRVVVYRLATIDRLTPADCVLLADMLGTFVGSGSMPPASYDYAGAMLSGTRLVKRLPFMRSCLDSVFCSELIAAVLQRLCRMNRENPSRFSPGLLLRRLVRQGTYGACVELSR